MDLIAMVAVAGAVLLVVAGIGHLRHLVGLRAVLGAQRLLPPRWRGPVAAFTAVAELTVGGSVLIVQLATHLPVAQMALLAAAQRVPLAAQSAMYVAFAGYLVALRQLRPSAPCGCFGGSDPVTGSVIGRAGLLAIGTAAAALVPAGIGGGAGSAVVASPVVLAGGAVLAMVAWLLPTLHALRHESAARRAGPASTD
jgi:hypothetical protein